MPIISMVVHIVIKINIKGRRTMIHARPLNPLEHNQFKSNVHIRTKNPFVIKVNALIRRNIARIKKITETTKYSFAGSQSFLNETDILYSLFRFYFVYFLNK
jgi:hypothetical protein